jgi:hypothetical protein
MASATLKSGRVEIAAETIARLLARRQVCAADLRCLACKSHECLWRLCLKSCLMGTEAPKRKRVEFPCEG